MDLADPAPTDLERRALWMLAAGDDLRLAALRAQLEVARVGLREVTGHGFFTTLQVPRSAPAIVGLPKRMLDDLFGEVEGFEHGVGFILWLEDGYADCLECFAYTDEGPGPDARLLSLTWQAGVPTPVREGSKAKAWRMAEAPERDLAWALGPR